MSRRSEMFKKLFDLKRNPFGHGSITVPGVESPFYLDLYPGIAQHMAVAFLGPNRAPPIALLWSLGAGENARGFGKTRYLLWFADNVNRDRGRSALVRAGSSQLTEQILAVYSTFQTLRGVSLSHLLFDIVHSAVAGTRAPAASLLSGIAGSGRTIYADVSELITETRQPWSPALLRRLCHGSADQLALFLEDPSKFRDWHRARWGRELFRTMVAFLRVLGVNRIIVLVDQVEDFASWVTPASKLRRDFARLAELCGNDLILMGHVTFVLTMHPDSARILSRYWPTEELGNFSPSKHNSHVVVLREPPVFGMIGMVKAYLDREREIRGGDRLRPFTASAVEAVHGLCGGRPGHCIEAFGTLLETAADSRVSRIDDAAVSAWLGKD